MTSDEKIAVCTVVGVLLLTDGHLTDKEHDFFYDLMTRLGLRTEERSRVTKGIQIDVDLAEHIGHLVRGGHEDELLCELRAAIALGEEASPAEKDLIAQVEGLLNVTE